LIGASCISAEPFAEKVVEQQVEKETTKKKEEIVDPAITEFTEGIRALTPKWIQEVILKNRGSFIRSQEKNPTLNLSPKEISEDERLAIIRSLKQQTEGLFSTQLKFNLETLRGKLYSKTSNELTRIYFPQSEDDLSQQFREKISISSPDTLSRYTWLTFRFFKNPFDRVWIYSPKGKKSRPIAPQLRSESLFFSALSADDLFGFSGNLNNVEVTFGAVETQLIPIKKGAFSLSKVGSCNIFLKHQSPPLDGKETSLPTNITIPSTELTSRETIAISLVHQDPFNNYGKVSLILDRQSRIPVYKKTELRNGELLSLSINALASIEKDSKEVSIWTYGQHTEKASSLIEYQEYTVCSENQFQLEIGDFDPARLEHQP
jgi:hypothetical protein